MVITFAKLFQCYCSLLEINQNERFKFPGPPSTQTRASNGNIIRHTIFYCLLSWPPSPPLSCNYASKIPRTQWNNAKRNLKLNYPTLTHNFTTHCRSMHFCFIISLALRLDLNFNPVVSKVLSLTVSHLSHTLQLLRISGL